MKLFKGLLMTMIIFGAIAAAGYYFLNKYIEGRTVEYVEQDLDDSNIAMARDFVDSSPSLKAYISEGADANLEELPFQTREEATRAVMKKLSLQELQSIQSKVAGGMTEAEAMELADTFEEKLTAEELLALKAIVYKELYE